MGDFTVKLPLGAIWTPQFVTEIDAGKCIGCGRCFKACSRDVLTLVGIDASGNYAALGDDEDDDDDEYEKKVMILSHKENCIGCEACSKMCPKNCISNESAQV